jgi:hypothetical protein
MHVDFDIWHVIDVQYKAFDSKLLIIKLGSDSIDFENTLNSILMQFLHIYGRYLPTNKELWDDHLILLIRG